MHTRTHTTTCIHRAIAANLHHARKPHNRRLYVVYRLPRLQYLDSTPVTGEERREAAARGQFLVVRKPKTKSSSLLKSPVATEGPSNAQVSRSGLYTGLHMSKSAAAGAATSVASVAGSIFAAL